VVTPSVSSLLSSLLLSAVLFMPGLPVRAQTVVAGKVPEPVVMRERARAGQGDAKALLWLGNAFLTGHEGLPCDPMLADAFFLYVQRTHHQHVPGLRVLEADLRPGQRAQAEWLAQRADVRTLLAVVDSYLMH